MDNEKCSLCDEPMKSFVGPEKKPILKLCWDHDAKFVKANVKQRGRMLKKAQATPPVSSIGRKTPNRPLPRESVSATQRTSYVRALPSLDSRAPKPSSKSSA